MALKTWIDEIETAQGGLRSEAPLEPDSAQAGNYLPGEKEADQILFGARDQIVASGIFHVSPETQKAEKEIYRTYKAILNGDNDFTALRKSCASWIEAARNIPAQPSTTSLFGGSGK